MANTTDLISMAREGHPEAAGLLYEKHQPAIFRYLFYRVGDSRVAEDLTADVFIRMMQGFAQYTGGRGAFLGWLYRIARNLSIDHLRKNAVRLEAPLDEEMPSQETNPESSVMRNLDKSALVRALNQLGEDQREVVLLRFIQGYSLEESARALSRSETAVKALQRRALISLRKLLEEERIQI